MGLLDILNSVPAGGVSNDPRARAAPPGQGMSPTAKALLALLAIYAMKHLRRADAPPTQPGRPAGGNVSAGVPGGLGGALGGDLGDLLRGTLGGVLGGANKTISQGDLANALGSDTLEELSEQTGMNRGDLLSGLSQHLPRFVDQLTPDGRLPTEEEANRMV